MAKISKPALTPWFINSLNMINTMGWNGSLEKLTDAELKSFQYYANQLSLAAEAEIDRRSSVEYY